MNLVNQNVNREGHIVLTSLMITELPTVLNNPNRTSEALSTAKASPTADLTAGMVFPMVSGLLMILIVYKI